MEKNKSARRHSILKFPENEENKKLFDTIEQDYGNNPLKIRETDQYHLEYVHEFVDKWDMLIDWEARAQSEGEFFIKALKERGAVRILDVATGTGFHSVSLLKAGFDVTSVDGNPVMLAKAFENAKRQGYIMRTVQSDWRWLNRDIRDQYDAVICLGNSMTHMFNEIDRRKAIAEFYSVLNYNGVLLLDQRNYDAILDDGFSSKHVYYYCGKNVSAEPVHVDPGLARFRYHFHDGSDYFLNMYPLRKKYMVRLLKEVGFQRIYTYGDFKETYHQDDPDFFVHIAEKEYLQPENSD